MCWNILIGIFKGYKNLGNKLVKIHCSILILSFHWNNFLFMTDFLINIYHQFCFSLIPKVVNKSQQKQTNIFADISRKMVPVPGPRPFLLCNLQCWHYISVSNQIQKKCKSMILPFFWKRSNLKFECLMGAEYFEGWRFGSRNICSMLGQACGLENVGYNDMFISDVQLKNWKILIFLRFY